MRTFIVVVVVLVVGVCAARLAFHSHITGAEQNAAMYCKMVHVGAWPDYDHVYARQCRPNGSVNWEYVRGK